jgi:nucleotide-binding universal stress UspA family protein
MSTDAWIVGYDGTPDSDAALMWAATTASQTGGAVIATIAKDPMDNPRGIGWPESWWVDIEERARDLLADGPDVEWHVERRVGHAVSVLVDRAADSAAALVVGSRGHGALGDIFLGSVSQGVARRAQAPVVVVREPANPKARRVVVGVDGSEASGRALEYACARAARTGEKVMAVHAWFPSQITLDRYGCLPILNGETEEGAQAALDEIVDKARAEHPEVTLETALYRDGAPRALVDASWNASLIVVGSRGRGAVAQVLLGSTSHDVLHHAHCPVAVVR